MFSERNRGLIEIAPDLVSLYYLTLPIPKEICRNKYNAINGHSIVIN